MLSSPVQSQSPYVTIGGQRVDVRPGVKRRAAADPPQQDDAIHLAVTHLWQRLCPALLAHKGWLFGGLGVLGLVLGLAWLLNLRTVQRA